MRFAKVAGFVLGATLAWLLLFASPAHADPASDGQQFVGMINELRASLGAGPLTMDGNLNDIALAWSQKMADAGDISHNPSLRDLVTANWNKLGENVGVGPT